MKAGELHGWACEHVGNMSGPCVRCAPPQNVCGLCKQPVDNHPLAKAPGKCEVLAA